MEGKALTTQQKIFILRHAKTNTAKQLAEKLSVDASMVEEYTASTGIELKVDLIELHGQRVKHYLIGNTITRSPAVETVLPLVKEYLEECWNKGYLVISTDAAWKAIRSKTKYGWCTISEVFRTEMKRRRSAGSAIGVKLGVWKLLKPETTEK